MIDDRTPGRDAWAIRARDLGASETRMDDRASSLNATAAPRAGLSSTAERNRGVSCQLRGHGGQGRSMWSEARRALSSCFPRHHTRGHASGASGTTGHRPRTSVAAGEIGRFVLAALGAKDHSVRYVERAAPQWTATGEFTATGDAAIAEGDNKTVIVAPRCASSALLGCHSCCCVEMSGSRSRSTSC